MSGDDAAGFENVFRQRWRERQSGGNQPGDLIRQSHWIDPGLIALGVLLAAGVVAGALVTVEQTVAFPAIAHDVSVSAVRDSGPAPNVGSAAQFRDTTGSVIDAVVVGVAPTEVMAELSRPAPPSAGQLLIPMGRQRLVSVLVPRLG